MNEFELINKYFSPSGSSRKDIFLGIGDDCALLVPPSGQLLAVTTDTLVCGVHFAEQTHPYDIGYKSLAVNLSDLAAMAAEPAWFSLALTLPQVDEMWLEAFCQGFAALQSPFKLGLVGGDTTRGHLSISITAQGFVPADKCLTRAGAKVGDKIWVTGTLGDAGAGLKILQGKLNTAPEYENFLLSRLHRPTPRVGEGLSLRNLAHAAIDISDGLAADLTHVLKSSGVGATIFVDHLPISTALGQTVPLSQAWQLALSAGDDYELCFTLPAAKQAKLNFGCTCIGEITAEPGLRLQLSSGETYDGLSRLGYQHFG